MFTSVQLTTTAKGRPLMVIDGYSYIRDRQTDEKTYWHCENHKKFNCHYRIHTCNFTTNAAHANILKCNGVHTRHAPNQTRTQTVWKFGFGTNEFGFGFGFGFGSRLESIPRLNR